MTKLVMHASINQTKIKHSTLKELNIFLVPINISTFFLVPIIFFYQFLVPQIFYVTTFGQCFLFNSCISRINTKTKICIFKGIKYRKNTNILTRTNARYLLGAFEYLNSFFY
jgi:hypothetical protein